MSLTLGERPASAGGERPGGSARTTWATVDTGFDVASAGGNFLGSVYETESGAFVAFDPTSSPIGRYSTRESARSAVEGWQPPAERERRLAFDRSMLPAATVSAIVAGGVALAAGLLAPVL